MHFTTTSGGNPFTPHDAQSNAVVGTEMRRHDDADDTHLLDHTDTLRRSVSLSEPYRTHFSAIATSATSILLRTSFILASSSGCFLDSSFLAARSPPVPGGIASELCALQTPRTHTRFFCNVESRAHAIGRGMFRRRISNFRAAAQLSERSEDV